MNSKPLPGPSTEPRRHRTLALVLGSAAGMLAGFAVGYALGTIHAHERQLARGGHRGV